MSSNPWIRFVLWLIERVSTTPYDEAFAGDLSECYADGLCVRECLTQAILRMVSRIEERLLPLWAPLCYSVMFIVLHPLLRRLDEPLVQHVLTSHRGAASWPGSALLELGVGLLPATIFVWAGVLTYILARRRNVGSIEPFTVAVSLNVGAGLLSAEVLFRLSSMHYDLRQLASKNFYYPVAHQQFSWLLFFSLFIALSVLPAKSHLDCSKGSSNRTLSDGICHRLLIGLGLLKSQMSQDGYRPSFLRSGAFLALMFLASQFSIGAQNAQHRLVGTDGKLLEFETVSVKPNNSGATKMNIISPPMSNGMNVENMPPEEVVQWAFGIFLPETIVGVPGWAKEERYDIIAKVDDNDLQAFRKVTDPIQRMPMLQKILVDRFNLKFHYEMRELPVYALIVGKGGSKMIEIRPSIGPNGMKHGGGREVHKGHIKSMGQPMRPLVNQLTTELHRTVVDCTGLTGYYNFTLRWTPDEGAAPQSGAQDDNSAPSLFTALQEQLGLKLEAVKAPVQVLVLDRLDRPSEN